MSSGRRRYSEKEVARILKHADRLQAEAAGDNAAAGMTETELTSLAEELGLERRFVLAAIDSAERGDADVQTRWLGAPPSYELERTAEGHLTDEAWSAIVAEMNTKFGQSIPGDTDGATRYWRWKHDLGSVLLVATQLSDKVRLKLVSQIDDGLAVSCILAVASMLIGTGVFFAVDALRPWFSILFSILFVVGVAVTLRASANSWYKKDRRKLSRLLQEIEGLVSQERSPVRESHSNEEPLQQRLEQI